MLLQLIPGLGGLGRSETSWSEDSDLKLEAQISANGIP